jgi:hypothetical protein
MGFVKGYKGGKLIIKDKVVLRRDVASLKIEDKRIE